MCMSQIKVTNLTFCYEGSYDNIFENINFSIDTNWKLGFIGRNGKGKTTFLKLLLGKYEYRGSINIDTVFDYFPYEITDSMSKLAASDFMHDINDSNIAHALKREVVYDTNQKNKLSPIHLLTFIDNLLSC